MTELHVLKCDDASCKCVEHIRMIDKLYESFVLQLLKKLSLTQVIHIKVKKLVLVGRSN